MVGKLAWLEIFFPKKPLRNHLKIIYEDFGKIKKIAEYTSYCLAHKENQMCFVWRGGGVLISYLKFHHINTKYTQN